MSACLKPKFPCLWLLIAWVAPLAAWDSRAAEIVAPDTGAVAVVPYEATYKAKVGLVPAWVEVSLQVGVDDMWLFHSEVRGRGWASFKRSRIVETSQVRHDGTDLRPVRYEMHNSFSNKDRDIVTRFEGDRAAVSTFRGDELRVQAARPPVDLLTLRLVLSNDLARGRLAGQYAVVDGKGRLKVIEVTDAGMETLETGAGRFEARRLEYTSGKDRRFIIWFEPALGYQMVKLEQFEDGRLRGRLVLDEFRSLAQAP